MTLLYLKLNTINYKLYYFTEANKKLFILLYLIQTYTENKLDSNETTYQ